MHRNQKLSGRFLDARFHARADCTTVLDAFSGSGTTLVAARHLGRRALGIAIEERCWEIAATYQQILEFPSDVPLNTLRSSEITDPARSDVFRLAREARFPN